MSTHSQPLNWERFEKRYVPEPNSGCWLWLMSCTSDGYGYFCGEHVVVLAHRFAYEQRRGPIPAGLTIDHLCRVRSCVNPAHLEAVTNRENILRGQTLAAMNAAKIVARCGHPFTDEQGRAKRRCLPCWRARERARYVRTRERVA
jgi:hypothetical protein